MLQRRCGEITVSVVSTGLLSDVTVCGLDESLGDRLVCFHLVSRLYESIENWPTTQNQPNRAKERVHDLLLLTSADSKTPAK